MVEEAILLELLRKQLIKQTNTLREIAKPVNEHLEHCGFNVSMQQ